MKNTIKDFLLKWTDPKPQCDGMSADEQAGILEEEIKAYYKAEAIQDEQNKMDDDEAEQNDEMEIERQKHEEEQEQDLSN